MEMASGSRSRARRVTASSWSRCTTLPARRKRFADSYRCGAVEDLFEELVPDFQPDVVHFLHLFWGLSVRLPAIARRFGARTMATLTDLGPACHRGQLLDANLEACDGPCPSKCARCVRTQGPFDGGLAKRRLKGAAAEALSALGGLGLVVTESDLRERDREVRAAIGNLDQIVTPTRALASRLVATGVLAEMPRVLCYGLDERPFRDAPDRVPDGVFRIGFLGQFQPHKGLDTLFRAAAKMARSPMGGGAVGAATARQPGRRDVIATTSTAPGTRRCNDTCTLRARSSRSPRRTRCPSSTRSSSRAHGSRTRRSSCCKRA